MLPLVIEWQQPDFIYYASQQSFIVDQNLVLNNVVNVPSFAPTGNVAFSGQLPYINNLPLIYNNAGTGVPNTQLGSSTSYVPSHPGTVRGIIFHQVGGGGFADFLITGEDPYGNSLTETVNVNPGATTESVNNYSKVFSIEAQSTATAGGTIEVGLGYNGYTCLQY